jgi:hypothetical protein
MASLNDRNMSRDSSHIDSPLLYSNFGEGFHVLVSALILRFSSLLATMKQAF